MNARPSIDDKISVMIPTDSASSDVAAIRALFHSVLKLTAIAMTVVARDEGKVTDSYTSETRGLWVGENAPAPSYLPPSRLGETMDLALDAVTWKVHDTSRGTHVTAERLVPD